MTAPQLQQLARLVRGEPRAAARQLLVLVCEQLGMDLALICSVTPSGRRTIELAVNAHGQLIDIDGDPAPLSDSWCGQVLARDSPLLVDDATDDPVLRTLPATAAFDVGSFAGVTLRDQDGVTIGTLCAMGRTRHDSLNERDGRMLLGLGEVIMPLLANLESKIPVPRSSPDLSLIADAVSGARDVEQLSRPLLDALHDLTGLASSYLTVIHEEENRQEIRYARNTRAGFALPEGLRVPWEDTLCKRALDEGRPCTTDVPQVWGDSEAAAALGIQVYVSVPVSLSDGRVWGTLCVADSQHADGVDQHLPTMRLFARLIASQVEQEAAVTVERERAQLARAEADTDPLTRCATRRVVEPWLDVALAAASPGEAVLAIYIDVNDFKQVNDRLGHAAGDAVLAEVGRQLFGAAQPTDLVARMGGDEFLVAARLPRPMAEKVAERFRSAMRFTVPWGAEPIAVTASVGYAVSDGHDSAQLLAAADTAMYEVKRA